jgi:hypothetical protein
MISMLISPIGDFAFSGLYRNDGIRLVELGAEGEGENDLRVVLPPIAGVFTIKPNKKEHVVYKWSMDAKLITGISWGGADQ